LIVAANEDAGVFFVTLTVHTPRLSPFSLPFLSEQTGVDFFEMDIEILAEAKTGKRPPVETSSADSDFPFFNVTVGGGASVQTELFTT
jgi:hypothetical protein